MIDPAHMPTNPVAPQVHIERVIADGREVARNAKHRGATGQRRTGIPFRRLELHRAQKVQLPVSAGGLRQGLGGRRRPAYWPFTRTSSRGPTRFSVIAANADGVWNEQGDTMAISLRPHYYQTAWFRLLCGGLAFAALIGIYLLARPAPEPQTAGVAKNPRPAGIRSRRDAPAELARTNAALQSEEIQLKQRTQVLEKKSRSAGGRRRRCGNPGCFIIPLSSNCPAPRSARAGRAVMSWSIPCFAKAKA